MEKSEVGRAERIKNELLDAGADETVLIGKEILHIAFSEAKDWILNYYAKIKAKSEKRKQPQALITVSETPEEKLQKLQNEIDVYNKWSAMGEETKEISVLWAMKKLGYSQEEIQNVLDLAAGRCSIEEIQDRKNSSTPV